ncbi:putative SWI/SNF-related matrix-associated actin-dependent regulator of chromatin subfamily A member 3-like [Lachnellula occidentalis]|uniref:Putative SWI/SNF-related matrix-associated actin-dependent regulator of chromatin subfamily A member 3-like n=1 Tax=Lachnellula occidentalis TaxID=215460 RepID=A0A8H8S5C9_9HELO|nr:putative SWI/SNF-related matrix-associated actin-dependent regulator of chromatin subfamily A member 3-like [Lachnellula occidentalis]
MNDRLYQPQRHEHGFPAPKRQCLNGQTPYSTGETLSHSTSSKPEFMSYLNTNVGQNTFEEAWTTTSQYEQDISAVLPFETSQLSSEFSQDIYSDYSEASRSTDWQQQEFGFGGFIGSANNPFNLDPTATSSGDGASFSKETTPNPEPPNWEICFGMITDIPIKATRSGMMIMDASIIPLDFVRPNQLHEIGQDSAFGELKDRIAQIIYNINTEQDIKFQIYCRATNKRASNLKKGSRKPGANELQYVMNAIIYGPEELCDSVGEYLTKCGICLQTPLLCDRDVPYQNPQVLCRAKELVTTFSLRDNNSATEVAKVLTSNSIFSALTSNVDDHLEVTEAPSVIATPLYVHQKKGLTFMIKREGGWQYDDSQEEDLWVKEIDEFGHVKYTNTITEMSQSHEPPDSRGGLLADQMGLGKSLTMISLIALNRCNVTGLIHTEQGPLRRLKSTLMVVPYSHADRDRHLQPNTLTWMRYHGSQKRKTLSLGRFDIVITTFETLAGEQKKHLDSSNIKDTLFSYFWHRVVLDEGKATAIARASCAIKATSRWAITGTPIQNRVTDFSSLLEFLQIYPFSNPKIFDKEVIKPWLKSEDRDSTRLRKLVKSISLCRSKGVIDLPPRQDFIRNLRFNPEEQELYNNVKESTIKKLDTALSSNPLQPGQYLNALQWLNELRLLCNHGLAHSKRPVAKPLEPSQQDIQVWTKASANKAFETILCAGEAQCSVCWELLRDGAGGGQNADIPKPHLTRCLTLICGFCFKSSPRSQQMSTCSHTSPCKSFEVSWNSDSISTPELDGLLLAAQPELVSTKLQTLLKDLQSSPKEEKSVVFSYWTFTLDLIESLLRAKSISYTRIDGRHSGAKREDAIQKFQTDESIQVILVSITCGGAGLDLTAASIAYLIEPQWNPMTEEQALCRIHRLGQRKEVKTIRYRIENSFEQKVVATQELKDGIAVEAFGPEVRDYAMDSRQRLQNKLADLTYNQEMRDRLS